MSDEKVYRCENCGGIMEFDVKTQTLKCPNCETSIQIENDTSSIVEHDLTLDSKRIGIIQISNFTNRATIIIVVNIIVSW